MRFKLLTAVLSAALSISLLGAISASAATEFGDNCIADRSAGADEVDATVFGISSTSSPFPVAAPSAGVITRWRLNLLTPLPPEPPIPAIVPQTLKVLRLNAGVKTAQVIGESAGLVGSGTNTIPARIPVQPGDRLGLYGHGPIVYEGETFELGTLYCDEEAAGDIVGAYPGNATVGTTVSYEEGPEIRVPAVAIIEPDADNDGFGDETQDQCPQNAVTRAACPPPPPAPLTPPAAVSFSTTKQVKKGAVIVLVTSDSAAPVSVRGVVNLGKGKKAKIKGGTQSLSPGVFGKFVLKLPKPVKAKLAKLPRKKSLVLKAFVTGTNSAGAVTKKTLKVKLKGRAKPKAKKRSKS